MVESVSSLQTRPVSSGKNPNHDLVDSFYDRELGFQFPPNDCPPSSGCIATGTVVCAPSVRREHQSQTFRNTGTGRVQGFYDIFYDRIHIEPARLELGNMLSAQVRDVTLWSAFFEPKELVSIEKQGTEGLDLDTGVEIPYTFEPMESRVFQLSISLDGPPSISANYRFNFGEANDPTLHVTGDRVVVFSLPPDTSKQYRETLNWATNIITAYDGTEQRVSLKDYPSVSVSMTVNAQGVSSGFMSSLLWGWHTRSFALPLWHMSSNLKSSVQIGSGEVFLDTSNRPFRPDTLAVLLTDSHNYEAVEIKEVHPDKLVLKRPLEYAWGFGTPVMPARVAQLPPSVKRDWQTPNLVSSAITFEFSDDEVAPEGSFGETYKGYPVMPVAPNFSGGKQETNTANMQEVTTRTGTTVYDVRSELGHISWDFKWWLRHRENIEKFRRWCYSNRGSAGIFWVPTWKFDLYLGEAVKQGANAITIKSISYSAMYELNTGRNHFRMTLKNGTVFMREIKGAVKSSNNPEHELITIDEPFPYQIEPSEVFMICFIGLHRFDSDTVQLDWKSDELVETNTTVRLLTHGV